MNYTEIIKGNRRFDIFRQLQNHRTLVSLRVPALKYEQLTIVTGTLLRNRAPCFLIDTPVGFAETVTGHNGQVAHFEFISHDNILHTFKTAVVGISGSDVCLRFPDQIGRLQRRDDFRVAPPMGTQMHISRDPIRITMSILNISRGGALVHPFPSGSPSREVVELVVGSRLKNIELEFPADQTMRRIEVKEAQVRRQAADPLSTRITCAVQFTRIEKDQEKELVHLLYRFQRELLQKKRTVVG